MNRSRLLTHEPPVFFNRGPSPATRWVLFSLISIAAIVSDYRFHYLTPVRQAVATVLYPIQVALSSPLLAYDYVARLFSGQEELRAQNTELQQRFLEQSAEIQHMRAMVEEYTYLKALAGVPERFSTQGIVAEIVRIPRSPFNHRVMLNRGAVAGVKAGMPVIDALGVVGQVTTVTPVSSEATLLTDKDQAVPVMVARNGLRLLATGNGRHGTLGIPFLAASADVRTGDELVTSGIDGVYPPGLAVATVENIDRGAVPFIKVVARPAGGVDRHRYLMVLTANAAVAYPPADFGEAAAGPDGAPAVSSRRSRSGRKP